MTQAAQESLGTRTELFIGGEWRSGSTGDSIEVLDPGTGRPVAVVASGSPDDAVAAVSAAAAAQPEWAARPPRDRSEVLRECWRLMHVHADELARLLVSEQGKPLAEAHGELDYAAEFFRWNAEETVRIGGRLAPDSVRRQPGARQPPPGRGRRDGVALELPCRDDHPEGGPGARRRQRRGHQTGGRDAPDRARTWAS